MMVSPSDVIVVDVMEIDGVIMIVFVVGSEDIINSAEMVNILRIEGARIAQELEDALNALVSYATKVIKISCYFIIIIGSTIVQLLHAGISNS